jgi:hypothetical protein
MFAATNVERGHDEQAERRRKRQAAEDGDGHGAARFGAGAQAEHDGTAAIMVATVVMEIGRRRVGPASSIASIRAEAPRVRSSRSRRG